MTKLKLATFGQVCVLAGRSCAMPKSSIHTFPLSCLFGVAKPSGPTSMSVIHDLQQLIAGSKLFVDGDKLEKIKGKKVSRKRGKPPRDSVKVGQGGTLDPLADGVLVIGVGKGTKKLGDFLDCAKEYRTTCLLGCETDSYDSEGARVRVAPWHHVTKKQVETVLPQFRGEIFQTPPIFSALKMDGKPLYEYARKGIPLPRPIEARKVVVQSLKVDVWKGSEHPFRWPEKMFSEDDKKAMQAALQGANLDVPINDEPDQVKEDEVPTAFVLSMIVSGGTYVRSIVHDLAHALGSAGHVVTLTRSRQGRFTLEATEEGDQTCVPWEVFERALENPGEVDEDGLTEWEREVLNRMEVVEENPEKP